jgi:hypothetical protein
VERIFATYVQLRHSIRKLIIRSCASPTLVWKDQTDVALAILIALKINSEEILDARPSYGGGDGLQQTQAKHTSHAIFRSGSDRLDE